MADYSADFPEIATIQNAPVTLPTGQRQATLSDGEWASIPQPGCATCPAHLSEGGTHETVGRHYCTANVSVNPISSDERFDLDILRRIEHFLHYTYWLVHGHPSANPGFTYNATGYNNFSLYFGANVQSGSGTTLTLEVGADDPRNAVISFAGDREEWNEPLAFITTRGAVCVPGDALSITGNSVLAGRITAKIIDVDYSGVSPDGLSGTYTVTIDQTISNVMTPADPESEDPPTVLVTRESFHPEMWVDFPWPNPLFVKEKTIELTEWDESGIIELLDHDDESSLIAYPISDGSTAPYVSSGSFTSGGTFKLEINYGDGYVDKTNDMRVNLVDYWGFNRIAIDHVSTSDYSTKLYLGALDQAGNAQDNWLTGATSVKVRYCARYNDRTVEGVFSPCEFSCQYDKEDYNKVLGTAANVSGAGTTGSRHFYCLLREIVPVDVLEKYRPNRCMMLGVCPYFKPSSPSRVDEAAWARLYSEQNQFVKQIAPGNSSPNNFYIERNATPSFHYLMNPPTVYQSPSQFFGAFFPESGGIVKYLGVVEDESENEHLDTVVGAIYNLNYVTSFLAYPSMPADMRGIIARSLTSFIPHRSIGVDIYDDTNDPIKIGQWWCGARKIATALRDAAIYGTGLLYSLRDRPGLEGENRIQRFDRTEAFYITNLQQGLNGTAQPHISYDNVVMHTTPLTVDGEDDIVAEITLYADGAVNFGKKRNGGTAFDGIVWRVESLGSNLYRVHFMLGEYTLAVPSVGQDVGMLFFGSGNAVQLPYPYAVSGYYNNPNMKGIGPHHQKIAEGDTLSFRPITDRKFPVIESSAASGDDLSDETSDSWVEVFDCGQYFDPSIIFESDPDAVIEITKFEVDYFSGAYDDYTGGITQILVTSPRPNGVDLSDIRLLWDHIDYTDPLGNANVSGSDRAFLSYANYYWAYLGVSNAARITYEIDGVEQTPIVIHAVPIEFALDHSPDLTKVSQWQIYKILKTNEFVPLTYKGTVTSSEDLVNGPGEAQWAFNTATSKIVFHPNMAGYKVYVKYKTTDVIDLGEFPVDVLGYPDVLSLDYLKLCDTAVVLDEGGVLGRLASLDVLAEDQYTVDGSLVLDPLSDIEVYYAEYGTETWTQIAAEHLIIWPATGKIYIRAGGMVGVPQNFCLKFVARKANRSGETPAALIKAAYEHVELCDTTTTNFITGGSTTGITVWGAIPTYWEFITDGHGTYPKAGLPDEHYDEIVVTTGGTPTSIQIGSDGWWADEVRDHAGTDAIYQAPLAIIEWAELLKKFPEGTVINEAYIEVTAPGELEVITLRSAFKFFYNEFDIHTWDLWDGSVPGEPTPPFTLGRFVTSEFADVKFGLVGKKNDGAWYPLGVFETGSSTLRQGKQSVITFTQTLTKVLSLRDSEYVDFAIYPTSVGDETVDPDLFNPTVPNDYAGLLVNLVLSNRRIIDCGVNEYPDPWDHNQIRYIAAENRYLNMDAMPGFGQMVVKYTLPGAVLQQRLNYYNVPILSPRE